MGLVVSVGSDKSLVAEMRELDSGEVGYVAEMVTDAAKLDTFHPGWSAKGRAFAEAAEDDKPSFAVVRVEEGWSRNGKLYNAEFMDSIAEQTNSLEPVGHLGHIDPDKVSTAFPPPQTTWFGAVAKTEPSKAKERLGQPVKAVYFAGYNLPGAQIRTYLKTKAVRGISWFGRGDHVQVPGKGAEIRNFALLALDWARKGSEGMPTSSVVAIASEMEGSKVADKSLAQVSPEEFKTENPNGYALLVAEIEGKSTDTIAEMEQKLDAAKKESDLLAEIRKTLKVGENDDLLTVIANTMSKLGAKAKETVDQLLDKVLEEKVPDEKTRLLVKRLMPVTEMEAKATDVDDEGAEKIVSEMVEDTFNKDDMVKELVSEQAPPVIRRREDLRKGGSGDNPYIGERARVTLS